MGDVSERESSVTDIDGTLLVAKGMTPDEIDGFRAGIALCETVQDGQGHPRMSASAEVGICAGTALNLRDLLTAVLAGDTEATALAKEVCGA